MRHATVWGVQDVAGAQNFDWRNATRACDWTRRIAEGETRFGAGDAGSLVAGRFATLPDCPICASFIDAALVVRAEAEQEKINAEIDAERRASWVS